MAKKRKIVETTISQDRHDNAQFDAEEHFNDSEDEFYAARDKVLLDDSPAAKRRRRAVEQEKDLQPSDEEVLAHDKSEEDEDDFDDAQSEAPTDESLENENDETWGAAKADYYNADIIETEADALEEEAEARRLQQKQLKSMANTDFGFDEAEWTQTTSVQKSRPVVEKLPDVRIPANASRSDKLSILQNRYPEFELLAKDLARLQGLQKDIQTQSDSAGIIKKAKLRAITAYLAAITMYFAIVSSSKIQGDDTHITSLSPIELREHPIINTLMTTRQMWETIKDSEETIQLSSKSEVNLRDSRVDGVKIGKNTSHKALAKKNLFVAASPAEMERYSDAESISSMQVPDDNSKHKNRKQISLQSLVDQLEVPVSLDESSFGDEAPLTAEEAAAKVKRKKSLRFYTSQIAQKANKRGAASRQAGGDDDVPHRDRSRDKQEKLLKEAERRGYQEPTERERLDDEDGASDNAQTGNDDDDGYYESLLAQSKQRKKDRQSRAEAYSEAARSGAQVYEKEQIGPDGKRRITYAIEKNKGLTPKRKKDVRNPRVKKRKKFDEKVKKLGSVRQVYKGGEGKGGYKGEMTGIKTNIVKSVKLS